MERVIAETGILRSTFHAVADGDYPWLDAVHATAPLRWTEHQFDTEVELRAGALKIVSDSSSAYRTRVHLSVRRCRYMFLRRPACASFFSSCTIGMLSAPDECLYLTHISQPLSTLR